jgi:hypothetical protein
MKRKLKSVFVVVFIFALADVYSQEVLRVASKTDQKTFKVNDSDTLKIDAEKAHIEIEGWDQNYLTISITRISKHQNGEIAVEELDYLNYDLQKKGNLITFSNYFRSPSEFKKTKGLLTISVAIKVPNKTAVIIQNRFGSSSVSYLSNYLSLTNRFVETKIEKCNGELKLTSFFGSNEIVNFKGSFLFELERSDLRTKNISGMISGVSRFGKVSMVASELSELTINSQNSEIEIEMHDQKSRYNYHLKTSFNKIFLKDGTDDTYKNEWIKSYDPSNPQITINTTYSPITIISKNHE